MDQDAFRKLVSSSTPSSSNQRPGVSSSRGSILPSRTGKNAESTKGEAAKPEFKPRKVNKGKGAGYRDRAAERRLGVAGDFAQAEELLEKFEQQHADDEDRDAVEEKRRYLGGDLEHTVLVKGLDVALMEQVRARDASKFNVEEEEHLENAFRAVASSHASENNTKSSSNPKGKKRTREDMIRELKEKRANGEEHVKGIEEAKQEGKFKPIGFKPIGSAGKKGKDKEGVKKKKRKAGVDEKEDARRSTVQQDTSRENASSSKPSAPVLPSATQEPEQIDDDDIFADAGEYEGLKLDDGDDDSGEEEEVKGGTEPRPERREEERPLSDAPRKWFEDDDEMPVDELRSQDKEKQPIRDSGIQDDDHNKRRDEDEQEDSERMVRLAPLQSSTSIRDILAADEALEAEEMRKARKEKRKAGGDVDGGEEKKKKKVSAETKLNREYKKLQAYTEKKSQR
ncbi:hypothetical protein SCHPADRAFT_913371 [Schizopora paradoxa]|uniref:RED-like N-terminal domain-containing protein n=1 Tax=Schizopora paradoxa TaxID=27342 RepID=A0A0H2S8J4_9AGAM|nr:hypothetical protein SCHPADRAFT_913371 [Schizopora paradoxa]